jgi:hypothetical protein
MSRKARRGDRKRSNAVYIIPILIVVTGVVGYYIFTQSGAASGSPLDNTLVSPTVLNYLSGVSASTLAQVGSGPSGIAAPTATATAGASPLTLNGKPEVLYMGAEFCPYCAAERWAMIVAFDKFGNFSGIQYMQSSSTDIYASTPTFTFVHATYTSNYVAFVTVEQLDRNSAPLQTATTEETTLLNTYDTGQGIPFVDFANQYTIVSSQYLPSVLANGNWTQIASQLNTPSSTYAMNIDGAANRIISAICKIDGGAPTSVCSQSFAQTLSYTRASPSGGSQLLVSDAALRAPALSAAAARFAPTRVARWV